MALLNARGELGLDQEYVHESIVGTLFRGRLAETAKVGSIDAVVPEITGSAHISGVNYILFDPQDPVGYGFHIYGSQSARVSRVK